MNSLIGIFKKIGNLKDLVTKNKTSLVSSVNEVTTEQNSMKEQLSSSVQSIEAGLNYNTIKVVKNDGTTENILIKIQGGSSNSINVFKSSQSIGSYVATGTVNTFVIDDIDNTKDVDLVYNNFLLIRGVDYTVDKETGTIGLSFDLKENEVIYYILTNTSYDYNDLNNLPNIGDLQDLSTKSKEVVGAINEISQQTSKLSETDKELLKQINVLEDSPNFTGSPKIQGQQIAVKDTIVEIWSGNIVNGTITLSEKITNFNRIDLHTQPAGGYGYTPYSFDRGQHGWKLQTNTKYAIPIATGKGLDIVFSDDGMSATVSNNTGILRRIFAFKKG